MFAIDLSYFITYILFPTYIKIPSKSTDELCCERSVDVIFQSLDLLRDEDSERVEYESRRVGRFLLRSLETEREASELDVELADELDPESDSDSDSESSELSEEDLEDLLAFFRVLPSSSFAFPLDPSRASRSCSFDSKIRFAVPLFVLNSSGTSTEGFPSAFNFASNFGFSSISVREGRDTYGRVDLHSNMKCPVPRHF